MSDIQLYRVIEPQFERTNIEVDTNHRELSARIKFTRFYSPIFDLVVLFWKETGIQIGTAVYLLSHIENYLGAVEAAIQSQEIDFSLNRFFANEQVKSIPLLKIYQYMAGYLEVLKELHRPPTSEWEQYIWEYLWEKERVESFADEPSRQTCLFAFGNLQDLKMYMQELEAKKKKKNETQICIVEMKEIYALKKYDSRWLDNLPCETATYNTYLIASRNYWSGKKSKKPLMEYLFHGKYTLKVLELK